MGQPLNAQLCATRCGRTKENALPHGDKALTEAQEPDQLSEALSTFSAGLSAGLLDANLALVSDEISPAT